MRVDVLGVRATSVLPGLIALVTSARASRGTVGVRLLGAVRARLRHAGARGEVIDLPALAVATEVGSWTVGADTAAVSDVPVHPFRAIFLLAAVGPVRVRVHALAALVVDHLIL